MFLNETGFNKHIRRRRGRSRVGVNAVQLVRTAAGVRLNMCCAVSARWGIVHDEITTGEWNQQMFASFLTQMMRSPVFQTSKILVMDGVSWHHTALIRQTLEGNPVTHRIEQLPPYTPHINAIEYRFSRWKADIRKEEHTRTSNLRQQIEAQRVRITDGYVARCTDHVYRYYQHCIEKRPLVTPLPDVPETPPPEPSTP